MLQNFGYYLAVDMTQNHRRLNPLSPELNPVCYLLALLAHDFFHASRIGAKSLTLRLLMSYTHKHTHTHIYICV
jgi:transposase